MSDKIEPALTAEEWREALSKPLGPIWMDLSDRIEALLPPA